MTTYSKAFELVEKYTNVRWDIDPDTAKQCALIAIDEIIKVSMDNLYSEKYWQEVKQQILAL